MATQEPTLGGQEAHEVAQAIDTLRRIFVPYRVDRQCTELCKGINHRIALPVIRGASFSIEDIPADVLVSYRVGHDPCAECHRPNPIDGAAVDDVMRQRAQEIAALIRGHCPTNFIAALRTALQ